MWFCAAQMKWMRLRRKSFYVALIILSALLTCSDCCYLWGTDSGECSKDVKDGLWRQTFMPFCSKAVKYAACIPKFQSLPPSREFPLGRWFNHTTLTKDTWVHDTSGSFIRERMELERNKTLRKARTNEFGDDGKIRRRFYKKKDCKNAFRNLFCWLNFPRCDFKSDQTFPTCRSACENFFISCGYERGLWRCGRSKYFNGYRPEKPRKKDGNVTYLREYFPGQPFRDNKFFSGGSEAAICTPAIDGAAAHGATGMDRIVLFIAWICVCILVVLLSV